jgi:hypothetical protein
VAQYRARVQPPPPSGFSIPARAGPRGASRALSLARLLARFGGSCPCRARGPPSHSRAPRPARGARPSVRRSPLCPPLDAWAERKSLATRSDRCAPGKQPPAATSEASPARNRASLEDPRSQGILAWSSAVLEWGPAPSCSARAHLGLASHRGAGALVPGERRGREGRLDSYGWGLDSGGQGLGDKTQMGMGPSDPPTSSYPPSTPRPLRP